MSVKCMWVCARECGESFKLWFKVIILSIMYRYEVKNVVFAM
jgi:hypothetical protein